MADDLPFGNNPAGSGLSAEETVSEFRDLVERTPTTASGCLDRMVSVIETSEAARVRFIDAVAELIVTLSPEGARYPARILADLMDDDSMMVRDKAVETVAELTAVLGTDHLRQANPLLETACRLLAGEDHNLVREQAGTACLVLGLARNDLGLPWIALIVRYIMITLPATRAEQAIESALDCFPVEATPVRPIATIN